MCVVLSTSLTNTNFTPMDIQPVFFFLLKFSSGNLIKKNVNFCCKNLKKSPIFFSPAAVRRAIEKKPYNFFACGDPSKKKTYIFFACQCGELTTTKCPITFLHAILDHQLASRKIFSRNLKNKKSQYTRKKKP